MEEAMEEGPLDMSPPEPHLPLEDVIFNAMQKQRKMVAHLIALPDDPVGVRNNRGELMLTDRAFADAVAWDVVQHLQATLNYLIDYGRHPRDQDN
jgi:hypothetical protein